LPGFSKSDCIESFLEKAYDELKPLGVSISADIFGLTAWKTDDFGVGQVLEKMAPHLDVICPMFYPSHFPTGFLGKQSPGDFPEVIMEASMRSMMNEQTSRFDPGFKGSGTSRNKLPPRSMASKKHQAAVGRSGVQPDAMDCHTRPWQHEPVYVCPRPTFYPSVADLLSENRSINTWAKHRCQLHQF
jgi:hypothetical protein